MNWKSRFFIKSGYYNVSSPSTALFKMLSMSSHNNFWGTVFWLGMYTHLKNFPLLII